MGVRRKEKGDEAETGATPQGHLEEPLIHLFLLPPAEWGGRCNRSQGSPMHDHWGQGMAIVVRTHPLGSGHANWGVRVCPLGSGHAHWQSLAAFSGTLLAGLWILGCQAPHKAWPHPHLCFQAW